MRETRVRMVHSFRPWAMHHLKRQCQQLRKDKHPSSANMHTPHMGLPTYGQTDLFVPTFFSLRGETKGWVVVLSMVNPSFFGGGKMVVVDI